MNTILSSVNLKQLRVVALLEGISLLSLFITMPLKYGMDILWPNKIVGSVHGLLFILYVFFVIAMKIKHNWSFSKMALGLIASIIPFGTFVADAKLFRD